MMSLVHNYQGIKGLRAIAEKFGINPSTLRHRVNKRGMDIEQALGIKPYVKPKNTMGVRKPDLLSDLWCLALSINRGANHD